MVMALEGVRVLDLSRALAGPFCTQLLGDSGADVVKVEQPGLGDTSRAWGPPFEGGESSYFLSVNRNKRSLTLDLRHEDGRAALRRLVARSDVLVENFVPGVMERLGFGYEQCRALRPSLIYCGISGFGRVGPDRERPAFDQVLQGLGGIMSITGEPGAPPARIGIAIADLVAGMIAAYAITAALFHRERSGEGQRVDTSLLEGQAALMTYQAGRYFATGEAPGPAGRQHPTIVPYGVYAASDGYVCLCVGTDAQWRRCAVALGLAALADDARFATNAARVAQRDALNAALEPALAARTAADLERTLVGAGVPCGTVRDLHALFGDEQVAALGLVQHLAHPTADALRTVAPPFHMSATPPALRLPPPLLGQHSHEVLREAGYTDEEIGELKAAGAI
jgi:crotonobetainyl-CoA:carnitine CoA-transferase CaiB-like acyl-CoA transferase